MNKLRNVILFFLLFQACGSSTRHYQDEKIPVQSLNGTIIDSASIDYSEEELAYQGVTFRGFSLEFFSPNIYEGLNLKDKYWYSSDDVILIASKVQDRYSQKEFVSIDTLIDLEKPLTSEFYRINSAYYGHRWVSKRLPNDVEGDNQEETYRLLVEDKGDVYPGPKCIITFNKDLKIILIQVEEMDRSKRYR